MLPLAVTGWDPRLSPPALPFNMAQAAVEHPHGKLSLSLVDGQRGHRAESARSATQHPKPFFKGHLDQPVPFFGSGLFGFAILDQLDSYHQALASDVVDQAMPPGPILHSDCRTRLPQDTTAGKCFLAGA